MREVQEQKTGDNGGKCCLTCGCITLLVIFGIIGLCIYTGRMLIKEGVEPYLVKEPRKFVTEVLSAEETTQAVREWNTFSDNLEKGRKASISFNSKQINSVIADKKLQDSLAVNVRESDVVVSFAFKFPFTEKFADCDVTVTPQGDKDFGLEMECFGDKPITEDIKKSVREGGKQGSVQNFDVDLFKVENGEVTIELTPKK